MEEALAEALDAAFSAKADAPHGDRAKAGTE
jgi:hypothetical protein